MMREYWDALQPRERVIVTIAALFITIMVLYLVLFEPYIAERERLERRVINQQEDIQWMRVAAAQLKSAQKSTGKKRASGQSLLSFVDSSAKEKGLGSAIKRVQPEGKRVRIQLEKVSFDDMIGWLSKIESAGYVIDGVVVEQHPDNGRVNARVVIGGSK